MLTFILILSHMACIFLASQISGWIFVAWLVGFYIATNWSPFPEEKAKFMIAVNVFLIIVAIAIDIYRLEVLHLPSFL